MNILDYIPHGIDNAISREELEELTGFPDRYNRQLIKKERRKGNLVLSLKRGYFQPTPEEAHLKDKWVKRERGRYISGLAVVSRIEKVDMRTLEFELEEARKKLEVM